MNNSNPDILVKRVESLTFIHPAHSEGHGVDPITSLGNAPSDHSERDGFTIGVRMMGNPEGTHGELTMYGNDAAKIYEVVRDFLRHGGG